MWHGYRRVETLFGASSWRERLRNLTQTWETPDQIATGLVVTFLAIGATALFGQDYVGAGVQPSLSVPHVAPSQWAPVST